MAVLVQFDFPFQGPFGDELASVARDLATSINEEPGFLWKIWLENPTVKEAGGIYLFRDLETARSYVDKHTARLGQFGVTNPNVKMFEINEPLTRMTHGPIA